MINQVFVTDANYKHALGIVRSLGRMSLKVYCGSSGSSQALSSFSRYTVKSLIYPDPKNHPDLFKDFIIKSSKKIGYEVVIPVGYSATLALSKAKNEVKVTIPISDFGSLNIAASKEKTVLLAKELGIPVPNTIIPTSRDLNLESFKYPLVVKGVRESGFVKYAYNKQSLKRSFEEIYQQQGLFPIIQEYIPGDGYGFFALFNHGNPRAIFMHRRIRMYPIKGGQSTCAESIYELSLLRYGLKLLKALNWHGVAMVEFKKDDRDDKFKLIEINPKFWGSLDLAIVSGVDFPKLLYTLAIDGEVGPVTHYRTNVKFMWPFPDDFLRVIDKVFNIKTFVADLFSSRVYKNFILSDFRPNLMQLVNTIALFRNKLRTKNLYGRGIK